MWSARRILKELADADRRKRILVAFWRYGDASAKAMAMAQLARAVHFRDETLRKLPLDKKADLLASRIGVAEFDHSLETALMQYHTHEASDMMAAFLDRWGVPHVKGSIEAEEYKVPTADQVRAAVSELREAYDRNDIAIYLASAGLLMSDQWRDATWPVVDEIVSR